MRTATVLSVPLLLALATHATASGLLVPRSGEPPIQIRSHRVRATLENGIARTTVRQTFVNPHGRALEAIYVFPLPENAALCDVAMEVGGKRLEGLLAERKQARRVYNQIVRRKRDPALVEQIGRNKFRLSVYPVLPNVETVVELTYIERVPLERGAFRYVYPLALGGPASKTKEDFTFSLAVKSSAPLESVTATGAGAQVVRRAAGDYAVSIERTAAALDTDVVVQARVADERPALAVQTFRGPSGDGWFLLLVTPPPVSDEHLVPRDVVLVIDTSGSMQGDKIEQAKRSALYLLAGLRSVDRVNVLAFSSDVRAFADRLVEATPDNLTKLRAFVSAIEAKGGTAIADALKTALDVPAADGRVRTVVFLTDGQPTVGETAPKAILGIAKAGRSTGLRIFPFGVGSDVNGALLDGIAAATRGRSEVFRPGGEIETRLKRFLDRTSAPVLADLDVHVPGTHDVFPRPLPDVYLGEQVAVVGRYTKGAERDIVVAATAGAQRTVMTTRADFRTDAGGSTAVRDLFARMKLDFLERQRRLRTGLSDDAYYAALDRGAYSTNDEIVSEMISVSLEHGVQSAYASFIVLLPEDRHRIDPRDRAALEQAINRVRAVRSDLAGDEASAPVAELGDDVVEELEVDDESAFEGKQSNAAIGLGGGAGGAFGSRRGGGRPDTRGKVRRYGGEGTSSAVERGLEWLANHQEPDEGHWPEKTASSRDTGLALLAFLGAGYTHLAGKYKKTVADAIKYLRRTQRPDGCFADATDLRGHAIATLAMGEAYGMTKSPLLRRPFERGIDYLLKVADRPADPSDVIWAALAFAASENAGLGNAPQAVARAKSWLGVAPTGDDATHSGFVFARALLGEDPKGATLKDAYDRLFATVDRHAAAKPITGDVRFWYLATLAAFQHGGAPWKRVNQALKVALLDTQLKDGATARELATLGPIASTAMATMCLEVYYRYKGVFGTTTK